VELEKSRHGGTKLFSHKVWQSARVIHLRQLDSAAILLWFVRRSQNYRLDATAILDWRQAIKETCSLPWRVAMRGGFCLLGFDLVDRKDIICCDSPPHALPSLHVLSDPRPLGRIGTSEGRFLVHYCVVLTLRASISCTLTWWNSVSRLSSLRRNSGFDNRTVGSFDKKPPFYPLNYGDVLLW